MAELFTLESLVALLTLTALEIVLGIDNIVFIVVTTARLEQRSQPLARRVGLLAAMLMRILLLVGIKWMMGLSGELFSVGEHSVSGKDLILLAGGVFLLAKATHELHQRLELPAPEEQRRRVASSFAGVIAQIAIIDMVFSIDSVITAVGMARHIAIMIAAIVAAVVVMIIFANVVSDFIEQHPTMKVLALAFLLLIGVMLVAEAFHQHISRGYIYFAMAFSLGVELLNMRARKARAKLRLNRPHLPADQPGVA